MNAIRVVAALVIISQSAKGGLVFEPLEGAHFGQSINIWTGPLGGFNPQLQRSSDGTLSYSAETVQYEEVAITQGAETSIWVDIIPNPGGSPALDPKLLSKSLVIESGNQRTPCCQNPAMAAVAEAGFSFRINATDGSTGTPIPSDAISLYGFMSVDSVGGASAHATALLVGQWRYDIDSVHGDNNILIPLPSGIEGLQTGFAKSMSFSTSTDAYGVQLNGYQRNEATAQIDPYFVINPKYKDLYTVEISSGFTDVRDGSPQDSAPEPSTCALFGIGLLSAAVIRTKRERSRHPANLNQRRTGFQG